MAKVVPSFIVDYINKAFPSPEPIQFLTGSDVGFVRGLEGLLKEVDSVLLPNSGDDAATLIACRAAMMSQVRIWEQLGTGNGNLTRIAGQKDSIIENVRRILKKCPDEAIPSTDKSLDFINNQEFKQQCYNDLEAIDFQLRHEIWKPATVLAGALIEALLCDALRAPAMLKRLGLKEADLMKGTLYDMISWAIAAKLINEKTERQCTLSGEYRNLIHPGREIRLKMQCNKATALSATAGLHHVIVDLKRGIS